MLFPALLLLVSPATFQSLGHTEVTVSNDPSMHQRPATWQPLQRDTLTASSNGIEVDYDVTFTNPHGVQVTFSSMRGFGASFVNGGFYNGGAPCWGIEFFQDDYYLFLQLPAPVTVDPGQSVTLTGTGVVPGPAWSGAPFSWSLCVEDGLHSTSSMRIWPRVGRPVPSWQASGGSTTMTGTDHGSVVTKHDMTIVTQYELLPTGTQGCTAANPNSTGALGELEALGAAHAAPGDSLLTLRAKGLPPGSFALPLVGRLGQPPIALGSGAGILCISGVNRWGGGVGTTGTTGSLLIPVDTLSLSSAVGAIAPGTTLHFQLWHRDVDQGQATSNTTGSTQVLFQ